MSTVSPNMNFTISVSTDATGQKCSVKVTCPPYEAGKPPVDAAVANAYAIVSELRKRLPGQREIFYYTEAVNVAALMGATYQYQSYAHAYAYGSDAHASAPVAKPAPPRPVDARLSLAGMRDCD